MIKDEERYPARVGVELAALAGSLVKHGETLWTRSQQWVRQPPPDILALGPDPDDPDTHKPLTDEALEDRGMDQRASNYHKEITALLETLEKSSRRLGVLVGMVCPNPPQQLHNRDLLAAQVATEGWCVSCWRHDQHLTPIALRPSKDPTQRAQPYYRDRCRPCGEWKAAYGTDPPASILELRHNGQRITTADVDRALNKSA